MHSSKFYSVFLFHFVLFICVNNSVSNEKPEYIEGSKCERVSGIIIARIHFWFEIEIYNGKDWLAGKAQGTISGNSVFHLATSRLTAGCSFPELVGKQKRNGIVFIDSFEGLTGIILEDFYKLRMKLVVKWFHGTNLWSACRSSSQWYQVSVEEVFVIVLCDSMNLVSGFIRKSERLTGFIRHCEMKAKAFKAGRPQDKTNSFRNRSKI